VGVSGVQPPNHPSPEELSVVEVEARICKVYDSVATLSPGPASTLYEMESLVLGSRL
jgi:hypothetical protein